MGTDLTVGEGKVSIPSSWSASSTALMKEFPGAPPAYSAPAVAGGPFFASGAVSSVESTIPDRR